MQLISSDKMRANERVTRRLDQAGVPAFSFLLIPVEVLVRISIFSEKGLRLLTYARKTVIFIMSI